MAGGRGDGERMAVGAGELDEGQQCFDVVGTKRAQEDGPGGQAGGGTSDVGYGEGWGEFEDQEGGRGRE
jgi:hypothetical protein